MRSIVVLKRYIAEGNAQRLIYDAKQDRIIHQFKEMGMGPWIEDKFSCLGGGDENDHYSNLYLPEIS